VICQLGITQIDHDLGAWPGQRARWHPGHLEWQRSIVDLADLTVGAAYRDDRPGREALGRSLGADHRRHAQLASDDRGVAGAPAAAGDDRSGRLHYRLPIGAGRLSHQHLARVERGEVVLIRYDPNLAGGDLLPDGPAGCQHPAGCL